MEQQRNETKPPRRIDWNCLWKEDYARQPRAEDEQFWDDFAPHFRKKLLEEEDPYVRIFYDYSGFLPGETIFDMGCAAGMLAIPYAMQGHEVWAADFSREMLKYLMIGAEEAGVADRIHPIQLDWNEDWTLRNDLPKCDVAISSRSFIAWDLSRAIRNLESVAGRKVCIGAWDIPVEGYDRHVAKAIGYERPGYGCYVYILNELIDRDLQPELRFIKSPFRLEKYESRQQALEAQIASFRYGLTAQQRKQLEAYCQEHLKYYEEETGGYWKFDHTDMSTIAHISWETGEA